MPDQTPADELRTAAARFRCDHFHPITPPEGTVRKPGPCNHCGIVADIGLPLTDVPQSLLEPLAEWLDETARQYEMPPCDHPDRACNGCERRDDFICASTVARVILGGDRG